MGKRLAGSGYAVVVVNQFYRARKLPIAPNGANTPISELLPLAQALNETTHMTDAPRRSSRGWTTRNSPHLQASKTKAQFLIAIASNDDERSPNEKNVLKETFENAKLPAEIEVYSGAHGWCPPDSRVYNEPDAEKAWTRLLALYGKALV